MRDAVHPYGPLEHFRILDLTTELGQPASRFLADLGADVIKIEPPGGDSARWLAPFAGGERHIERSLFFLQFNTNKRGVVLDLSTARGREDFLRLVRTADGIVESFPPGHLASLGLGYDALCRERPDLVLTSITPFGQDGPYRHFRGNDFICDAAGGLVYMEGERHGRPVSQPRYQAIQMAGLHAAYGTLLAFWHRLQTGEGQQVDVSVQEVVAHEYLNIVNYSSRQEIVERVGTLSSGGPTNFFPCADGWVLISIVLPRQWTAFARWSEDPLLMDPLFENRTFRAEAIEFVTERMADFTRRFTIEEFLTGSIERRIPAGPVNDVRGFVEHPHTRAREFLVEVEHPVVGRYLASGAPAIYSATPWGVRRPAPLLGQHTAEVLEECSHAVDRGDGASPGDMSALFSAGESRPGGLSLPLEGVRVVDLTKEWAGPFATRYLADFGAEVIKVESLKFPEGRVLSREPDPVAWLRSNATYAEINRNKLSIALDLHTEEGKGLLKRLVAISDLVVENFHYATLARWGLDYEQLRKVNSRLIMLSSPAFGSSGPARDYFAYGGCIAAFSGLSHLWGHPGAEQKEKAKQAYADYVTAINLALAALAALLHREATGEGQHIEVAQAEAAGQMLGTAILEYTVNGENPQPWGNRNPHAAPQGAYPCLGEDRWIAISCTSDAEWLALCRVIGRDDLGSDSRLATKDGRAAHHDELDVVIAGWTRTQTPHQAMLRCQAAGVPAGVVATGEDLYLDPQLRSRGYIVEIDHPAPGRLEHPGMTVRLTRAPGQVRRPAPLTGQHNDYVFGQLLGLTEERKATLARDGVLA